jgi:hypothetical protein
MPSRPRAPGRKAQDFQNDVTRRIIFRRADRGELDQNEMKFRFGKPTFEKVRVESFGFFRVTPITPEKNYSEMIGEDGQRFPITGNSIW